MTEGAPGAGAGIAARVRGAWHALHGEQRIAAVGALGLIVSLFLPWFGGDGRTLKAIDAWSFVEASLLLVALATLGLLFARAERRAFHLPGGDGLALMGAGGWVMLLVFYRELDKPTSGVRMGIFVAFLCGALITYAGWRMRAQHRPEPPRTRPAAPTSSAPAERTTAPPATTPAAPRPGTRPQRRPDGQFEGQLSFEDPDAPGS